MEQRFARQAASYTGSYVPPSLPREPRYTPKDVPEPVYKEITKQSYKRKGKRKRDVGGYKLDETLSSHRYAVYVDPYEQRAVIGYRGSTTAGDWLRSDAGIARGRFGRTSRAKSDQRVYDQFRVKYGYGYKVDTTGHSLGGSSAARVANRNGLASTVYHPGTSLHKKPRWTKNPDISVRTSYFDPISTRSGGRGRKNRYDRTVRFLPWRYHTSY
jgi:hypothetical protein